MFGFHMRKDWPTLRQAGYPDASLFAPPTRAVLVAPGSAAGAARDSNDPPESPDSAAQPREPIAAAPRSGTPPSSNTGPGHRPSRCSNSARICHKEIAGNPAVALAPLPLRPGPKGHERVIIDPFGGTPSGLTAEAAAPGKKYGRLLPSSFLPSNSSPKQASPTHGLSPARYASARDR